MFSLFGFTVAGLGKFPQILSSKPCHRAIDALCNKVGNARRMAQSSLVDLLVTITYSRSNIKSGAATCSEGLVKYFLKVPIALMGTMAAAVKLRACGTLRKQLKNPAEQFAAPVYIVIRVRRSDS